MRKDYEEELSDAVSGGGCSETWEAAQKLRSQGNTTECCGETEKNRRNILKKIPQAVLAGSLSYLGIRGSEVAEAAGASVSQSTSEALHKYDKNNAVYNAIGDHSEQLLSELANIGVIQTNSVTGLMHDQSIVRDPNTMSGINGETDIILSWKNKEPTPTFKINKKFEGGTAILTIQPELNHSHAVIEYENADNSNTVAIQPTSEIPYRKSTQSDSYTTQSLDGCCLKSSTCAPYTGGGDCAAYTIYCCNFNCTVAGVDYGSNCSCSGKNGPCYDILCPC